MSDAAKLIGDSGSSRSEVVVNGNHKLNEHQECDSSESTAVSISLTSSAPSAARTEDLINHRASCTCSCDPKDFRSCQQSAQELRKETCKLVDSVDELFSVNRPNPSPAVLTNHSNSHKNCHCKCDKRKPASVVTPTNGDVSDDNDDWSLMLIGLAQLHPATSLVRMDPFDALPSISVVPPTPEGIFAQFCGSPNFEHSRGISAGVDVKRGRVDQLIEQANDVTLDDSPQDEEPPYRALNATLKRYGTMSSLERFSSEEKEEKAHNSSEEELEDADSKCWLSSSGKTKILHLILPTDVRIITKEIYGKGTGETTNWSNRAGTFLEQSRAFLDNYLGRWDRGATDEGHGDEEIIDECTSGATSGEDVWGTPTSGENDEMQMFNSELTNSVSDSFP